MEHLPPPMKGTIVIASTNLGKIQEIKSLLQSHQVQDYSFESLQRYTIPEPDEPFETFLENATYKAQYYARLTGQICLSEDSGLCIEALNHFPGVRSKEFIQERGGIEGAFEYLSQALSDIENPHAFFESTIVIASPESEVLITGGGKDWGHLCFPKRGSHGFGFDPIFVPEGYTQTFGELGMEIKNKVSHRAGAFEKIALYLNAKG